MASMTTKQAEEVSLMFNFLMFRLRYIKEQPEYLIDRDTLNYWLCTMELTQQQWV